LAYSSIKDKQDKDVFIRTGDNGKARIEVYWGIMYR